MEQLQQYLQDTHKRSFLDVGTGRGEFIRFVTHLYDRYKTIVGIDIVPHIIEQTQAQFKDPRISFVCMDANDMTFETNSFDVVMLSNSLHHLSDVKQTLSEMRRVVASDGFILINEMMSNHLTKAQMSHKKLHHFAAKIDRLRGGIHDETMTRDDILNVVTTNTNLGIVDSWVLQIPPYESNNNDDIQSYCDLVDQLVQRAPKEHMSSLMQEGEDIKEYIRTNGLDGCPSLVVLLHKENDTV